MILPGTKGQITGIRGMLYRDPRDKKFQKSFPINDLRSL